MRVEPTPGQYSPPLDGAKKVVFGYDYLGRRVDKRVYDWVGSDPNDWATTPASGDKKVEFKYDYLGRRVQKKVWTRQSGEWVLTDVRKFVWSGWLMLVELEGDTGDPPVDTVMRKYTWGLDLAGLNGGGGSLNGGGPASSRSLEGAGGIGGLLAMQAPGAGPGAGDLNAVYTYDANGNVGQLVAWAPELTTPPGEWSAGRLLAHYEYDPYGGVTAQSGTYAAANPVRFSTKYWDDETGLGYWGYRYYSPALGRWLNRDPIEEKGGWSLYGFAMNSPVNGVDALGEKLDWGLAPGERECRYEPGPRPSDEGYCTAILSKACCRHCCCKACPEAECRRAAARLCLKYVVMMRAWSSTNPDFRMCVELAQMIRNWNLSNECFQVRVANSTEGQRKHTFAAVFHVCNRTTTSDANLDPWRRWNIGGKPWAPYCPKTHHGGECIPELWPPAE